MEWDAEVSQGGDSFLDDGDSSSADDVVYQNLVIVEEARSIFKIIGMSLVNKNKPSWLWHHVASAPNRKEVGSEF